jgi:hypothetical protein
LEGTIVSDMFCGFCGFCGEFGTSVPRLQTTVPGVAAEQEPSVDVAELTGSVRRRGGLAKSRNLVVTVARVAVESPLFRTEMFSLTGLGRTTEVVPVTLIVAE